MSIAAFPPRAMLFGRLSIHLSAQRCAPPLELYAKIRTLSFSPNISWVGFTKGVTEHIFLEVLNQQGQEPVAIRSVVTGLLAFMTLPTAVPCATSSQCPWLCSFQHQSPCPAQSQPGSPKPLTVSGGKCHQPTLWRQPLPPWNFTQLYSLREERTVSFFNSGMGGWHWCRGLLLALQAGIMPAGACILWLKYVQYSKQTKIF